jgi:hypothetical protein
MEFLKEIFFHYFTEIHSKNENIIVNNISDNFNNKTANDLDNELDPYERKILDQKFDLCPICSQPNTHNNWCKVRMLF